ncbi:carboxypeptidase regulatory-like domain-containing protein [Piscinibacter sp.]|uniref:carboxypeptidase regulatory-like domain-containing protein n=1 Tax=Piscinibacter sp. TaxID=1903157 RepID=UPI002C55BD54|nr:carboxypeptidase regulatory-like domain-containing protein [Albitalea sp.]HUG21707.1 carboxypeptidase regulatory-like domain-containing protein [Albitalea sp.]
MTTMNRHPTLHMRSFWAAAAAAWALAATGASAQTTSPAAGQTATAPGAPDASLEPQVRREGNVAYVNGGIGERGEAKTMELGRDMNLKLVFARASGGGYLADANVLIADRSGNVVLQLESADPLLFAQLPPGTYRITATADGRTIERSVQVPANGQQTEHFHW